ncbi:MAG: HAMP domain-containing histidine kinase [Eubacteriaceae bacterium]|jgi:signal transduction histidine kinase|nr:HAMP domain-containing histidine kinase [Eubacteriaceae bacterium]
MLKKLQHRIILINMLLVGVIIISVVAAICVNTYREAASNITSALSASYKYYKNDDDSTPNFGGGSGVGNGTGNGTHSQWDKDLGRVFTVTVVCDTAGSIKSTVTKFGTMDTANLQTATALAFSSDSSSGRIKSLNLAYAKHIDEDKVVIVFADTYTTLSAAQTQITSSALMGGAALIILLMISILLSKVVCRPVEKAWTQQQQFVADASHELKTPLTVILANNDILLSKGHVDKTVTDQKQWVESTKTEAVHMKKLVDNLLFLARSDAAEAASQKIVFSEVVLSDVVMDSYLQFEPVAFEKGVLIDADIEPAVKVNGDPTQLKQLAHILIDNAIKYAGDNGRIFITVSKNGSAANFSVNNTGPAIPREDIKHIFERFYRADKARTQGSGYGLGLAIARSIVENHQGIISCVSTEADGTTFTASMPEAAAAASGKFKRQPKIKPSKNAPGAVSTADSASFRSDRSSDEPPAGVIDADYEVVDDGKDTGLKLSPGQAPLENRNAGAINKK